MYSSCAIGIVLVLASSALGAADSTAGVVIRAAGGITATAHGQLRSIHSADRLYAREVLNLSPESRAVIALANGARYQLNGRSKIEINSFTVCRAETRVRLRNWTLASCEIWCPNPKSWVRREAILLGD